MNIRKEYVDKHGGNVDEAAFEFAGDLMRGDPTIHKAGYTAENAAIAARDVFDVDEASLLERLRALVPRVILVHLNVELPTTDTRSDDEIADAIMAAYEVGSDNETVAGLKVVVTLAEEVSAVEEVKPVVVVVRHPDAENDISLHGVEARVIDLDLGRSFDRTPDSDEQAREWADAVLDGVQDLPADHPARITVEDVVATVCERLPAEELEDVIRRHGGWTRP